MEGRSLIIHGDVSPITGDLDHNGDVFVFGSIRPGYMIRAQGNLIVHGSITRARAFAGGDLVVYGIAGEGVLLDAVGSVVVGQARDAQILAGLDIEIRSAAMRCELVASRRILAMGVPGHIRGGSARAGLGIEVRGLGTSGGRYALVEVDRTGFESDRQEVTQRLEFVRGRTAKTLGAPPASADAYRRQVADANTYLELAAGLSWKLKQFESAGAHRGPNYIKVTGRGPTRARIALGPNGKKLASKDFVDAGAFTAMASGDGITTQRFEEDHRVG